MDGRKLSADCGRENGVALRIILSVIIAVCVSASAIAGEHGLPLHQCAVTSVNASRELRVQCTIEEPVMEDILTALSCKVWQKFHGSKYDIFVIDWDYEVESLDNTPWGTALFIGNRLDSVKIRQLRNSQAVGYRLYTKNLIVKN